MSRDFADFLAALNAAGARYVVIGGIAVLARIPYRTTRDIDVRIEPTLDNATRVREAVRAWSGIEPEYSAADFVSGDILSFGGLHRADVHANVPGGDRATVWARRVRGDFAGVPTDFASIEDLISMKEAAGRPGKDLPDVRRLKKLLARKPPG